MQNFIRKRDVLISKILDKMTTTEIHCLSALELNATMLKIFHNKSFAVRNDKTPKVLQQYKANTLARLPMMLAKIQSGLKLKNGYV
ncbi:unnamed protein product [Didymodactylos carnosus]|uniref:Uncharacterized protein n=1 Tax=Didymodactylos carnosus TaxID=1234261 RepID=A0A8S2G8S4_9BILA|nr:unnamed protein product [Didymodactylos carnosus]CAF4503337.1 unnamed protein product [Didymodactylos carnosus]